MSWIWVSFWENKEKEETVVPSKWIRDQTLLWPYCVNATNALKEKQQPSYDWKKYIVKSINDTHKKKIVLYWIQYKNTSKYKVGCFWRFSCLHNPLKSFNSIIVQMPEKRDSSHRKYKWMVASFSNFHGKIWADFYLSIRKRSFWEFSF